MNARIKIAPSLLTLGDRQEIPIKAKELETAGADMLHIDVMDGIFVPSVSQFIDPAITKNLANNINILLDVHLMVQKPAEYIKQFLGAGAQSITIHTESEGTILNLLEEIQEKKCRAGLAINPETELTEEIIEQCKKADMILLMTVVPGKPGQAYIESVNKKIAQAKRLFPNKDIQVDGGIKKENAYLPITAGANILVSGTGIFNEKNYEETIRKMKEIIIIGSDHAGFELKNEIKNVLNENKYAYYDCGADSFDPNDDYPIFISKVAEEVSRNPLAKGIVIGGSGQAEAILANKFSNVRAALFHGLTIPTEAADITGRKSVNPYEIIQLSREHNNANILSLGARFLRVEEAKKAVLLWLKTPFSNEERHIRRINMINQAERQ